MDAEELDGDDQAALLSMYDQLRQEVRAHGKRKTRRNLGAFTVLGLIIGYIFTSSGDARVLALVPYVLAFLYLAHISSVNYVIQLAALLALIETQIRTPGAEYEYYHGGLDIDKSPRFDSIDVVDHSQEELQDTVQTQVRTTMNILALITYFGAALGGFYFVSIQGFPEIGFEPSGWNALSGATYVAALVLASQVLFFYPVCKAWKAYQDHRDVLSKGVKEAYSGSFEEGMEGRIEALPPRESEEKS